MTTLNGILRSWDSFIQGICARKKLISFNRLREECAQEARLVTREKKMGATNDQALTIHTRKNFKKKEKKENFHHHKKKERKKIRPRQILPTFDAILVMKRDTLQETAPSGKRDTMIMLLKTMNQQTKDSEERKMIQMKSMC